jgi:trans-aconitate 2-methyltransferase
VAIWETEYLQQLGPVAGAHPVRTFSASVAANLVTDHLSDAEQAAFFADCDAALADHNPLLPHGGWLFPFRRLFIVLNRR